MAKLQIVLGLIAIFIGIYEFITKDYIFGNIYLHNVDGYMRYYLTFLNFLMGAYLIYNGYKKYKKEH